MDTKIGPFDLRECVMDVLGFVWAATDRGFYSVEKREEDVRVLGRWSAAPELVGTGRNRGRRRWDGEETLLGDGEDGALCACVPQG